MGVRLSNLKASTRETFVEYDGERVDFCYKPNEFTMELADTIQVAAEKESLEVVSSLLAPLIVWWDVLDDQDNRIPPSVENMRQFPMGFLNKIMDAINDDVTPETEG